MNVVCVVEIGSFFSLKGYCEPLLNKAQPLCQMGILVNVLDVAKSQKNSCDDTSNDLGEYLCGEQWIVDESVEKSACTHTSKSP